MPVEFADGTIYKYGNTYFSNIDDAEDKAEVYLRNCLGDLTGISLKDIYWVDNTHTMFIMTDTEIKFINLMGETTFSGSFPEGFDRNNIVKVYPNAIGSEFYLIANDYSIWHCDDQGIELCTEYDNKEYNAHIGLMGSFLIFMDDGYIYEY